MEAKCNLIWYTFSLNDVLRLPVPEDRNREKVEAFLFRDAEVLKSWNNRELDRLALFEWSWVWEKLRVAQLRLPDWYDTFRDLRFFFYIQEGGETLSIHLLAVQEDGENFLRTQREELRLRYQDVISLLEGA